MSATPTKKTPRRKYPPLKVYCTEVERAAIEKNAQAARLSTSEFLRLVGRGYEVRSQLDINNIKTLAKLGSDLGRIGGLLKALLTNEERFAGLSGQQLRTMTQAAVQELVKNQEQMRLFAESLERHR